MPSVTQSDSYLYKTSEYLKSIGLAGHFTSEDAMVEVLEVLYARDSKTWRSRPDGFAR